MSLRFTLFCLLQLACLWSVLLAQFAPPVGDSAKIIESPHLEFPDYDCLTVPPSRGLEGRRWSDWLIDIFEGRPAREWITASNKYLAAIDRLDYEGWQELRHECPYGFATFLSIYLMQCMLQHRNQFHAVYEALKTVDLQTMIVDLPENTAQHSSQESPEGITSSRSTTKDDIRAQHAEALNAEYSCYGSFMTGNFFKDILTEHPPRILLGTRWPVLTALSARNLFNSLLGHNFWADRKKNCLDLPVEEQTADWRKLQRAFWRHDEVHHPHTGEVVDYVLSGSGGLESRKPDPDWYLPSLRFVFHSKLKNGAGYEECPLGFFLVEVLRAFIAMTTESRFFLLNEPTMLELFRTHEPGDWLFARWPFTMMLSHIRQSTRHKFKFDFNSREFVESIDFGAWPSSSTVRETDLYSVDPRKKRKPRDVVDRSGPMGIAKTSAPTRSVDYARSLPPSSFDVSSEASAELEKARGDQIEATSASRKLDVPIRAQTQTDKYQAIVPESLSTTGRLKFLALHGSELHRNVAEVLAQMPDIWRGGQSIEFEPQTGEDEELGHASILLDNGELPANHPGRRGPQVFPSPGFAFTTMVYGKTFRSYLKAFLKRWHTVTGGLRNMVVFTLGDDECYTLCRRTGAAGCVRGGTPGIMQKFTIPWVLALHGVDSVWVDFDVYPVQDPTYYILEHQNRLMHADQEPDADAVTASGIFTPRFSQNPGGYEILISGSFASHCICSGIVYFKATRNVVAWLVDVLSWMYEHPYEHDQKCFSAYLNFTEPITMKWWQLPRSGPLPRWSTLDPREHFITAAVVEGNGWMASSWRQIVLFHFLHGDSDKGSGLDFSGAWLQDSDVYAKMINSTAPDQQVENAELNNTERQQPPSSESDTVDEGQEHADTPLAKNVTLMERFYGAKASTATRIDALELSRQLERKTVLDGLTCGVIAYPLNDLTGKKNSKMDASAFPR
ncbi:unnamed protein product [Amoebophrya sp. A25]|nr:unnamed protein product [Amoebophrya sp. A25]|eukprot:GSA25T00021603001.1